jgi:ubiquinone/menaquinone biosynthesis C-methylase UbiE
MLRLWVLRGIGRLYLWATHRLYNEFAPLYDLASWLVSAGHWGEWRRLALDYVAGPRVLEVGFGTGELLAELARRRLGICGLELSPAMQQVTARKLRRHGLSTPRLRGRVQTLPFGDGCFDTIVSTFPAEYIVDPDALKEMRRVLREPRGPDDPGGRLVIVGLAVYRSGAPLPARFRVRPEDSGLEPFCEQLNSAGLACHLISRFSGPARVPVVVAERRPHLHLGAVQV